MEKINKTMKLPKFNWYWLEVIFILLVGLTPLLWFKDGYLAAGHDMSYPLAPIDFWLDRLYVWTDRVGSFGSNQSDAIPGIFIHGLQALFYTLTGSLQLAQKFDFVFWFSLPGITMYILLRSLHPKIEDFPIRISGALFYMINYYLLQAWIIAEMSKFSIVAALPIVALAIINVNLKKGSVFKNSLLVGITLFFLNGGAGIPLWGGLVVVGLTVLSVTFWASREHLIDKIKRLLGFVSLSLVFVILFNFYWIYPYLAAYKYNYSQRIGMAGGSEGATAWSQEISKNASFTNLFKLQGIPDWYDNLNHPYANTLLTNYFFLFLSIVLSSIAFVGLLNKKSELYFSLVYKFVFLAILLVTVLFTAGSHPPTGVLYDLALKYIPGFPIFRTPFYKFGMGLWFAFAYLFAIGLQRLSNLSKHPRLILFTIMILLGIYHYPTFTGSFFNWSKKYSTRVAVPSYIYDTKKELDANRFSTRTLMLPQLHDGNKYIAYDWKYFSLSSIPSILSRRPVLLNDAVLIGNESGLVNSIYEQLEKDSQSSLLKYAGVDKVLIQNDFIADEDFNYRVKPSKKSPIMESRISSRKQMDRWEIVDISNPETKPLIYLPQTLSLIDIETSHLAKISQTDDFPTLADAFLFKPMGKDSGMITDINRNNIQNIIVQGWCTNCQERRQVEIARSSHPSISPSNPLYFIIEFIDQRKIQKYKLDTERIDFILGTMSKEVTAMDTIITNPKNNDTINYLLTKWSTNIKLIDNHYRNIDQTNPKEEYARRIYYYYWSLLTYIQKWSKLELTTIAQIKLSLFENLLNKNVQDLSIRPQTPPTSYDIRSKFYNILLPEKGTYKLAVYNYKANDGKLSGFLNNLPYDLTKQSSESKWYFSQALDLDEGGQEMVLPQLKRQEKIYPGFKINTPEKSIKCQEVNLGRVDPDITYDLSLEYLTFSTKSVDIGLFETNDSLSLVNKLPMSPQIDRDATDPYFYRSNIEYKPSTYTQTAFIRVCVWGGYDYSSSFELKRMKSVERYPDFLVFLTKENPPIIKSDYSLKFVALNQTAYLLQISGVVDDFILGFNSRFDHQWNIKEISPNQAAPYFTGLTKKYMNGQVTEYERQDKHLVWNSIFVGNQVGGERFELNSYGNGWAISRNDKPERAFLIEYQSQRILYKTIAVSLASLIGVILVYLILFSRRHEK